MTDKEKEILKLIVLTLLSGILTNKTQLLSVRAVLKEKGMITHKELKDMDKLSAELSIKKLEKKEEVIEKIINELLKEL